MKRLFNLILACLLIVSLSACGKQAETENDMTGGQEQQTQETKPADSRRRRWQYSDGRYFF